MHYAKHVRAYYILVLLKLHCCYKQTELAKKRLQDLLAKNPDAHAIRLGLKTREGR